MAAIDLFERVVGEMSQKQREELAAILAGWREDLLAARSEEARLRLVHEYLAATHSRRTRSGGATAA